MKEIEFHGTVLDDIKDFPIDARQDAGYQLNKVQKGEDPDDWKPVHTVGKGVKEIRIREDGDTFRVMYVAKFEDAIHVLHAFQKKEQQTRKSDIDKARKRYKELVNRR